MNKFMDEYITWLPYFLGLIAVSCVGTMLTDIIGEWWDKFSPKHPKIKNVLEVIDRFIWD